MSSMLAKFARCAIVTLCVFGAALAGEAAAQATLRLESEDGAALDFATQGQTHQLKCSDTTASKLTVTYRPNSKTSVSMDVVGGGDGAFAWKPASPGLVAISAFVPGTESAVATKNFSVRFAETSVVGIVVMLFAALLLFGGAAFSIRALLRDDA